MTRRFRCPVQPCRHALGAMRHGAQARRVEVMELVEDDHWWNLTLECGHVVRRRVARIVYAPHDPIEPKFAYCLACPKKGDTGQLTLPCVEK